MPQDDYCGGGGGIGFGKCAYINVDSAIPHSKGLCSHTILVKRVFNSIMYYNPYVQATPKCKNHDTLKIIALHPYSSSEDCKFFLNILKNIRDKKI